MYAEKRDGAGKRLLGYMRGGGKIDPPPPSSMKQSPAHTSAFQRVMARGGGRSKGFRVTRICLPAV